MNSKISFTTMATPGLDLPAQASIAREYGFQGIDFRVGQPGRGEIPEDLTAAQAAGIKDIVKGLQLPGLLCYNQNIHAGKEALVGSVLNCIRIARLLDCPMVRIFTGRIGSPHELEALTEALGAVLERDSGAVRIGMQIHKNNGATVAQALEVCRRLQSGRVGIILSPDQSALDGEDYVPLLARAAKHVFQVYVADIDAQGRFTLIGDGIIDHGRILHTLRRSGFDGFITLKWEKCWLPQLPEYPEAFDSFFNYLSKEKLLTP